MGLGQRARDARKQHLSERDLTGTIISYERISKIF